MTVTSVVGGHAKAIGVLCVFDGGKNVKGEAGARLWCFLLGSGGGHGDGESVDVVSGVLVADRAEASKIEHLS